MKKMMWILMVAALSLVSCSRSSRYSRTLSVAERLAATDPDSALNMLSGIELSDIREDSLKALYGMAVASAHMAAESSMASDSLTHFAFGYYKGRDDERFLRAGALYAMHRFWLGEGDAALMLLDSLIRLPDIPESSMVELLRSRIDVGGQRRSDLRRNIAAIRQLMSMDRDEEFRSEYKRQLYLNYAYAGQNDSALILLDELIDDARSKKLAEQEFAYKYEKIAVLEEAGRYVESNQLADYIIEHAPENSALHFIHFSKALNYLNLKDFKSASDELTKADDYAKDIYSEESNYYESLAGHIRNILTFQNDGKISIIRVAEISNHQRDCWFRDKRIRNESKQNALKAENRVLAFKSQSERKTYIIVIVSLVALILVLCGVWMLQKRKRKMVDAEERAETLQKMVDELQKPAVPTDGQEALRRAMLQQLGIIKMVAEAPTEQNREMLRRISSIDADTRGSLVNWANVYEIIDNLYSGFYGKLHDRYGEVLTEKEEQIIVLMLAGFSTKEIGVITSQTTATIYVRKSSIRKKLGVPGKEDIISGLCGL